MSKQKRQKNIGPKGYLEISKEHKKWYEIETGMGKQRGKPKAVPPKSPKKKGEFSKHHHR